MRGHGRDRRDQIRKASSLSPSLPSPSSPSLLISASPVPRSSTNSSPSFSSILSPIDDICRFCQSKLDVGDPFEHYLTCSQLLAALKAPPALSREKIAANPCQKGAIVIDGPNICLSYSKRGIASKEAKYKGLQIAFEHFLKHGWSREGLWGVFPETWQSSLLDSLDKIGQILYVPLRHSEDDDLFAFAVARERGALLLTNDRFRNHQAKWDEEKRNWCAQQLLTYTFQRDTLVPHPETLSTAVKALGKTIAFKCSQCQSPIASSDDVITSSDPSGILRPETASNPAGSQFAFLKVKAVLPGSTQQHWNELISGKPVRQESLPRLQDTWFPDYAWSLLFCASDRCNMLSMFSSQPSSIGWKFRLIRDPTRPQPLFDLLPSEFYGLTSERLVQGEFQQSGAALESLSGSVLNPSFAPPSLSSSSSSSSSSTISSSSGFGSASASTCCFCCCCCCCSSTSCSSPPCFSTSCSLKSSCCSISSSSSDSTSKSSTTLTPPSPPS